MEALIFDLDGTLWDSTEEVAYSWNEALREETDMNRVLTAEELKKEFGKPLPEIVENVFPELSKEEQDELSEHLFRYENTWLEKAPCKIYDKMAETLQELSKRYKLFIVSNCQAGYIEAFLKNTGVGAYITDHTCPGDTGVLKAENIRIIMERNGVKDVAYVGDTQGDADACKAAGVPIIHAAYGFGQVEEPWKVIHSLEELLNLE
jgi:phosphoglycolate phosphatase